MTSFQFGLKLIIFKLNKSLFNTINILFFVNLNQNIIQIDHYRYVKFFDQDFINIALKTYLETSSSK